MSGTEDTNPRAKGLHALGTLELLRLMNDEDAAVLVAVRAAVGDVEKAVDEAVRAVKRGGKILYAGAGTSGRLAVLDASEMGPTFGVPEGLVSARIAGGDPALKGPVEGAEDDRGAGADAARTLGMKDFALGVSASGRTPFVLSFLEAAKEAGAASWLISSNNIERPGYVDGIIVLDTGPELVAGSTRLKAGTAQKLVLNMFSTALMVRLGRVHDGLMVDVMPTNDKLIARALGIIITLTGCPGEEARAYLEKSGMNAKTAVVMIKKGLTRVEAEELLKERSLSETLGVND